MKKILFIAFAVILSIALFVPVFAEEQGEIITVVQTPEDTQEMLETAEKSLAEQAGEWISEYAEKIVIILAAIYAVFPKFGLLPILINAISKINSHFNKNDPESFQNVLISNANTISAFMNDISPIIEDIKSGNKNAQEVLESVLAEKEKANAAISACQQSIILMAKQLNDLISCSTTISPKTKAQFENEWLEEIKKVNALCEPEKTENDSN